MNPLAIWWGFWTVVWILALLVASQGGWLGMIAVAAAYAVGRKQTPRRTTQ